MQCMHLIWYFKHHGWCSVVVWLFLRCQCKFRFRSQKLRFVLLFLGRWSQQSTNLFTAKRTRCLATSIYICFIGLLTWGLETDDAVIRMFGGRKNCSELLWASQREDWNLQQKIIASPITPEKFQSFAHLPSHIHVMFDVVCLSSSIALIPLFLSDSCSCNMTISIKNYFVKMSQVYRKDLA
jgi:hypothetical protein